MEEAALVREVVNSTEDRGGTRVLPCPTALGLAKRLGVAPREIGRVCDTHDIKIVACQLGCFG